MMKHSIRIIESAIKRYKPSHVIVSYSGGYDSLVLGHIVGRWYKQHAHSVTVRALSADTTISADGWRDYVQTSARLAGLPPLDIRQPTEHHLKLWVARILERGLPFCRSQHHVNFYYLKQTVFRAYVQEKKKHRKDRILYLNGVRRAESVQRSQTLEYGRQGAYAWCNPIVHVTDAQVLEYRISHDLPINPFYDTLGNSGDCLCNWHTRFTLDQVQRHAPDAYQRIRVLDEASRANHGYGYGEAPQAGAYDDTEADMIDGLPNLCVGCNKPKPTNEQLANRYLSSMEW